MDVYAIHDRICFIVATLMSRGPMYVYALHDRICAVPVKRTMKTTKDEPNDFCFFNSSSKAYRWADQILLTLLYFTLFGVTSSDVSRSNCTTSFTSCCLSSVSLTSTPRDAFVHFLILSINCILGRPRLLFQASFRECMSLLDYTYYFGMGVQRKPFFFG